MQGLGMHVKHEEKMVSHESQKTSFIRRSRKSSLQIQETKQVMEEREEERCYRKRGKKGPQRVSFLVKDCASVSVPGLPLGFAHLCFYSEGNWPSRKLPPGTKRLWFLEKGQVNFPLWTPTHCRAVLSPPPPVLFVFFFFTFDLGQRRHR